MDLDRAVARRVLTLCLNEHGALSHHTIAGAAVRGALLIDLGLAGRLTDADDGVQIDPTPTGFAPADLLLDAVTAKPDRSLGWWLQHWRCDAQDLADHLVSTGVWTCTTRTPTHPHRRFHDTADPDDKSRLGLASQVHSATHGGSCDRITAALASICQSAGITVDGPLRIPAEALLQQCQEAEWIVRAVVDYLVSVRVNAAAVSQVSGRAGAHTYLL